MFKKIFQIIAAMFLFINIAIAAVNINTASQSELESLPGVGPAKAKAIIEDRKKNGSFKSVDDLQRVKGIGGKIFAKIKPQLTVAGATGEVKSPQAAQKADKKK